jgi:phage terminase large subunit
MIQDIPSTKVLKQILRKANSSRILLLEGGSRSSKTWSIFQYFFIKALEGARRDVTIVREKLTWLKATLLKDFDEMTARYNLPVTPSVKISRPDQIYKINNVTFTFTGLDEPQKAHGMKQTDFWINEVIEMQNRNTFDQLEQRTTHLGFIDFNPSDDEHWVFDLKRREDVGCIHSTMLDNPFLEQSVRNKILSYEPTEYNYKHGTADVYMWEVYGLGKPAKLEGAIYTNWDIVDSIPENAKDLGWGLDFGYSRDETAVVDIYMLDNELYFDELIYESGLTNYSPDSDRHIVKKLTDLGIGSRPGTGDSSEPKSIDELRAHGFRINGAQKGPDSVNFGIKLLQGYKCHLTRRSVNLDKERRRYKWAQDRNGKTLDRPVDEYNHGMDAIRYRATEVLGKRKTATLYPMSGIG